MIRVGFIGAGQVNFGSELSEPWDHASRLEKMANIVPVAIVDPDVARANRELTKRQQKLPQFWAKTKIFSSVADFLSEKIADAVFIGVPPNTHVKPPSNLELLCANAGLHLFIEKPLSSLPPEELIAVRTGLELKKNLVVSVGYMFRYSKAVLTMKQLLEKHSTKIRVINLRYNCSYTSIPKLFWWDKSSSGGPIVEQATHFCDIARFLCGEVDLESIRAQSIAHDEHLGKLSLMPIDENLIEPQNRIPRVTTCFWRFTNGAIGTLTHALLLHGASYDTYIEIWADGLQMILEDPYNRCKLTVREPNSSVAKVLDLSWDTTGDDPYYNEDLAFFEAIRDTAKRQEIQSDFSDAMKTYELTWAIRRAASDHK